MTEAEGIANPLTDERRRTEMSIKRSAGRDRLGKRGRYMAGRSMKVRRVFAELRRALGAEIPAGELLGLAAALVDAAAPIECPDEHRSVPDRPALDHVPLDHAFSDGGWRIMHCESSWFPSSYRDDDPGFRAAKGRIGTEFAA
jgi:hypothetical protein